MWVLARILSSIVVLMMIFGASAPEQNRLWYLWVVIGYILTPVFDAILDFLFVGRQ